MWSRVDWVLYRGCEAVTMSCRLRRWPWRFRVLMGINGKERYRVKDFGFAVSNRLSLRVRGYMGVIGFVVVSR